MSRLPIFSLIKLFQICIQKNVDISPLSVPSFFISLNCQKTTVDMSNCKQNISTVVFDRKSGFLTFFPLLYYIFLKINILVLSCIIHTTFYDSHNCGKAG